MKVNTGTNDPEHRGQAVYSPLVLACYDVLVLGFSNHVLWRCPTSRLRSLYDRNVRDRHLDIGVGTGYFLTHSKWPTAEPEITLLDLNENSLAAAAQRIVRYAPKSITANALEPLPLTPSFSSIGACYLLHCLPGPMREKAPRLFQNIANIAVPGARVFGATILQGEAPRSWPAQKLMDFYNAKGIFSNKEDTLADLAEALDAAFTDVKLERIGAVGVFEAAARGGSDAESEAGKTN